MDVLPLTLPTPGQMLGGAATDTVTIFWCQLQAQQAPRRIQLQWDGIPRLKSSRTKVPTLIYGPGTSCGAHTVVFFRIGHIIFLLPNVLDLQQ
jgi:hypothetical protein